VEELSFAADGLIGEVNVYIGCRVKKGEALAKLDVGAYETQLEALRSSADYESASYELEHLQARCNIEIAKTELEKLKAAKASVVELSSKRIEIETLQNELDADARLFELSMKEKRRQISKLEEAIASGVLVSPCDGRVVYCTANEGGYAAAYAPFIWVADDSDIYIATSKYISGEKIKSADEVYATVAGERVEVEYQPYDRAEYLSIVASGAEPKAKFAIKDNKGAKVESGMYAVVYLIRDYTENALIIPSGALKRDNGGQLFVYKLVNGEKIKQTVKKGVATDALVQITEGLAEGDEVYVGN
jgi:macrolide-specific efflux system membrane fusion protein